jgi:hypothetical protein
MDPFESGTMAGAREASGKSDDTKPVASRCALCCISLGCFVCALRSQVSTSIAVFGMLASFALPGARYLSVWFAKVALHCY